MVYKIVNKVFVQGNFIGYKLQPLKEGFSLPVVMAEEYIIKGIKNGTVSIQGVKLTTTGKLRGCDGFLLSQVPEISIKDLAKVNADLLSVLTYVMSQMFPRPDSCTKYGAELNGLTATYFVNSRSENYYNMTHMNATDDLCGSLEFYAEHLPEDLEGKIDDIYGEVGDKGYFRIAVSKKLDI